MLSFAQWSAVVQLNEGMTQAPPIVIVNLSAGGAAKLEGESIHAAMSATTSAPPSDCQACCVQVFNIVRSPLQQVPNRFRGQDLLAPRVIHNR
jgi:hypothetical protein